MRAFDKEDKKNLSKLMLFYFFGAVLTIGFQLGGKLLLEKIWPEAVNDINRLMLILVLPTEVIIYPIWIFLVSRVKKPEDLQKGRKLKAGEIIILFFISYAMLYISSILTNIPLTIIRIFTGRGVTASITQVTLNGNVWINFFLACIITPIMEEMIFRKCLLDRTVAYGEWYAILLSGFMFGLFHGNIEQGPFAFVMGCAFAYIYVRTGRIQYTVILHALINFLGSVLGPFILKVSDYQKLMESLAEGVGQYITYVFSHLGGIMIFFGYMMLILAIVATGVILFFVFKKRIHFKDAQVDVSKGQHFSAVYLNVGMVAYISLWILMYMRSFG